MSTDSKVNYINISTIKEFCKTLVKGGKLKIQDDFEKYNYWICATKPLILR